MEDSEQIVVFRKFENSIDANIVKTKLDAYGIPCFLTEENLANLYPGQNFMMFSVRLHLFAKDVEQADVILTESNLEVHTDSLQNCPQCKSIHISRDFPKRFNEKLSSVLGVLFFGVLFPKHKIYRCRNCEFEF